MAIDIEAIQERINNAELAIPAIIVALQNLETRLAAIEDEE